MKSTVIGRMHKNTNTEYSYPDFMGMYSLEDLKRLAL